MKTSLYFLGFSLAVLASSFAQGTIGGTLAADTTLGIGDSPWTVNSKITVPSGITLTIDAGVRLEFDDGTGIVVDGGKMVATGAEISPIVFGRAPSATHTWDGFVFEDTLEDNRLRYFSMEYGDGAGHSIEVVRAKLTIGFGDWPTTERTMIEMDEPSVIIEHSSIPGISGGEVIHGQDLVAPGYLILRGNTFGKASNGGDVIDFTGAEGPGPVLQILDNVFEGGDDDGLDLDGTDAYVEGNIFMDFRKDPANTRATTSNAIATGLPQSGAPNRTRVTLVRNLFLNCDHAVLLKEEAFLTAENNTFVGMQQAVIQFDETGGTAVQGPGKGAVLEGNLFWDNVATFKHLISETELTVNYCLVEPEFHNRGVGNLHGDPGFVGQVSSDDSIPPGSPVIGTGPNGINIGHLVDPSASISGEPPEVTWRTEAQLIIDGPGMRKYRYRLNGEPWSADTPIEAPISLSGLSGNIHVQVLGQNTLGEWQADVTLAEVWTINPNFSELVLNEIDATSGQVEIWNNSATSIDTLDYTVNGYGIIPQVIPPNGYAVRPIPSLALHGQVNLWNADLEELDRVDYGIQIAGSSIGRVGRATDWILTKPTLGAANVRQPTALYGGLKINEWLLGSDCLFTEDFVELHNSEGLPVALAGLEIDIEPLLSGDSWVAPPLSFIGANGYTAVVADGLQANFDGAADLGAEIDLYDGGTVVDAVVNNSDIADVSGGRVPPGGDSFSTFTLPTPGFGVEVSTVETTTALVAIDDFWSYDDTDTDLGTAWREVAFDDSLWSTGGGLLGRETSPQNLPETLVTEVNYVEGIPSYYFRRHFNFSGDPADVALRLRTVVDDGAVFYLNGAELHRLRMDDPVSHAAFSSENVGDADYEGPFDLSAGSLLVGDNVLAVEVHQDDDGSSDIVFGLELEVVETKLVSEGLGASEAILAGLRLTEIMYHAADPGVDFLEFQNTGPTAFDLDGVRITDGVEFVFASRILEPGAFVYVVADTDAFGHPELEVAGEFSGLLFDDGDRLRVELSFGAGIVDVTYSDMIAVGTDGGGNSLELVNDGGLKNSFWAASSTSGGTFGALSEFETVGDWSAGVFTPAELEDELVSGPAADPDGDGLVNLLERLLGLDPKTPDAEGALDLQLDGSDAVLTFQRLAGVADADLLIAHSSDLNDWDTMIPGLSAEVISEAGGRQVIEVRVPAEVLGRGFLRIEGLQR